MQRKPELTDNFEYGVEPGGMLAGKGFAQAFVGDK
jgi:hypothetical protein